jgi:hypothetical protein
VSAGPRITVRPLGGPGRSSRSSARHRPYRQAFRAWRRSRPFWAGLWCLLGGLAIAAGPATAVRVVLVTGGSVALGILVGVLVALMGVLLWFAPHLRLVAGLLAILFSIVSLVTSDYGGFVVGLLLGTIGGAMGFAWAPDRVPPA